MSLLSSAIQLPMGQSSANRNQGRPAGTQCKDAYQPETVRVSLVLHNLAGEHGDGLVRETGRGEGGILALGENQTVGQGTWNQWSVIS